MIDKDVNSMYTARIMSMKFIEQTFTWQLYLAMLQSQYASWQKLGQECEGDGLADASELMQLKFPGPYSIIEVYDPKRMTMSLKLKFDDPRKEMLWRIHHG